MTRFLFATWEGGGHVQPMLLAARGLIQLGAECLVISDACNGADAAALRVPFHPWRTAPSRADRSPQSDPIKDWAATTPLAVIQSLADGLMCGPAALYARDTAAAIEAFRPDVVVSQELLLGVMAAAEAKGVPLALFAANVWPFPTLDGAPPFGAGLPPPVSDYDHSFYAQVTDITRTAFQHGLPALNTARAAMGLAPADDIFQQLDAAGRILLATSRAFDFDQAPPKPFRYVGPYLADPAWTRPWSPPWKDTPGLPLVLVSFSSMYQNQEPVLRRAIAALGGLDVRAVATLGPVLSPADFPAPANVAVTATAPHSQIFPRAAAMVTHAGHASTLRPLMAGVPLICLPLGRDQADNAARVTERGAGLRLPPDASVTQIAEAIQQVVSEPRFREAAAALGARITTDATARSAERELLAFAKVRMSSQRSVSA